MGFRGRRFRRRPVRRLQARRRPVFRRRRVIRRRRRPGTIIHVKKTAKIATFSVGTAPVTFGKAFSIADFFSNSASITNSFQQVRLNKLLVKVVPVINMATSGSTLLPRIVSVIDYTDATPESFDSLLNRANHRIHFGSAPFARMFTPAVKMDVNNAAAGTGSLPLVAGFKKWIDMDNTGAANVQYFGFKMSSEATGTTTNNYAAYIYATAYFSMKQPVLV